MSGRFLKAQGPRQGTAGSPALERPCEPSNITRPESFVEKGEAAVFLHMAEGTLMKHVRAGEIPAHPRGTGQRRRWLFLISELAEWMRSQVNSACDSCRDDRRSK